VVVASHSRIPTTAWMGPPFAGWQRLLGRLFARLLGLVQQRRAVVVAAGFASVRLDAAALAAPPTAAAALS